MRNKELATRRLEKLQTKLYVLKSSLNGMDILKSRAIIDEIQDLVNDILSIVERE